MKTPIWDFVREYAASDTVRAHMPGHKGQGEPGIEVFDITEIAGADELYRAKGIIAQSEDNARRLFDTGATFYGTGGSSQCLRAMLCIAKTLASRNEPAVLLAARNAHRSLLDAAALLNLDVRWLWPEAAQDHRLACTITPNGLERALDALEIRPFAIFLTSPDYLGNLADIPGLAQVAHRRGIPLLVDNAHGAYLAFVSPSLHPIHLGADLCCDSAHKTLPALTGGAYLHLAKGTGIGADLCRNALALFGSTSPSYLILASLDRTNGLLQAGYDRKILACCAKIDMLKKELRSQGWTVCGDPMRLTLVGDGHTVSSKLRSLSIEPEYVDDSVVVLMLSPNNSDDDFARIRYALLQIPSPSRPPYLKWMSPPVRRMSIRQATFAKWETIEVNGAEGRVAAVQTISCPPAVPIVVAGEQISAEMIAEMLAMGLNEIRVVAREDELL